MADTVPTPQYAAPAAVAHSEEERYIQQTPVWVVVVRGFQLLLSFVILCMAGYLIHGLAVGANVFALVCWLFTWIVVGYGLITEKVRGAQKAYNVWAVLSLDLLMAVFWLASLGANAALRAQFNTTINVDSCNNNGSAVNSNMCTVSSKKMKRGGVLADHTALACISAIAGLSALNWLLFIATLVFHGHTFRLWRQENKKPSVDNATAEMKLEGAPMLATQAVATQAVAAEPGAPQYSSQQQYQSQVYPSPAEADAYPQQAAVYPQPGVYPQQTAAGYPQQQPVQYQQTGESYASSYPDTNEAQYPYQQQPYSPHGTPAPGQPYYPPHQPPPK
ncbi:uncharacterized protein B0T15DRAFT_281724 [Chaetomium strumarium]|uniref:MARVEL domain-containing protein n=1 Tax=Chaetomium strumarium TaxID=1170767 RepID=A0AAJ0GPG0_9PEZI|nr:hypothetical protein B0T15DRAFT_281724 [Chaetomium strumarium]